MPFLLHPTYFSSVSQFVIVVVAEKIVFDRYDHFQKQTFRNRTSIYGANGKQNLSIPVKKKTNNKNTLYYKDVQIDHSENWASQHWKSITSAYWSSPFFEFYRDEIKPLFEIKSTFLYDHNLKTFEIIMKCLEIMPRYSFSTVFEKSPEKYKDYRYLVNAKTNSSYLKPYTQVFCQKYGFIHNLSILDLLFNEGPNTVLYLKKQRYW